MATMGTVLTLSREDAELCRTLHRQGAFGRINIADAYRKFAQMKRRKSPVGDAAWRSLYNAALSAIRAHLGLPSVASETTETYIDFETDNLKVKSTIRWGYAHNNPQTIYGSSGA